MRGHEIVPFLDNCSTTFRPIAEAAIYFGLRKTEICMTHVEDFDLSAGHLWVREKRELEWRPNSKRSRTISLVGRGREIAEQIVASRRPGELAWPTLAGERRKAGRWFPLAAQRAAEGAGIVRRITFHDLRRTFGATMVEANASLRAVQLAMGHAKISTTARIYAPITSRFMAAEMGKMDQFLRDREAEYRASQPTPPSRLRAVP